MTHLRTLQQKQKIFDLFEIEKKIEVMDIGAAAIAETPCYTSLLNNNLAHLTVFDGDKRQIEKLKKIYGSENVTVFEHFLFDGKEHEVYFCSPASGMTSIFKPNIKALEFFNGFNNFGKVERKEKILTKKLDSIKKLESPDFLKMDVQGAELKIIQNGKKTLKNCLAFQLEVSYFPLYEKQPTFGEIDLQMRKLGYVPHCFLAVKRWSITPTIFNNNFRVPGNQLLESDIVYVKDPIHFNLLTDEQLKKMSLLMHFCFKSVDFSTRIILEMEKRKLLEPKSHLYYLKKMNENN